MNFAHRCTIPVDQVSLWNFLMDVPKVSQCVPGVQDVNDLGGDSYGGLLRVKIGPVVLNLSGKIQIESRDEAQSRATMRADADDRKLAGSVKARMTMTLKELSAAETEFAVETTLTILGKIGEFGQPIIRKKADDMMQQFAKNVAIRMTGATASEGDSPAGAESTRADLGR